MSGLVIAVIGALVAAAVVLFDPGTAGRLARLSGSRAHPRARGGGCDGREPATGTGSGGSDSAVDRLAFDLELVAICLQSGLTPERALILAAQAAGDRSGLGRLGHAIALGQSTEIQPTERQPTERQPTESRQSGSAHAAAHEEPGITGGGSTGPITSRLPDTDERLRPVVSLIDFSRRTGVALAPLLRGLSADLRRSEHRRRQLAAARLGVTLVIPLGVCILPAFILLGIVPVVITLVSDMAGVFQ